MGPHIYVLGLSLSLRLNSEQLIYIIAGLSLSCRSNSEKRTKLTIVDVRIYIFTRIRSTSKTKLNYVADIVLDRKDTPYTPQSIPKSFALAVIGCRFLGSIISKFQPILTAE